ncbi:MAG: peptidoglycan-binding protein [Phycisphaerales bacterium]
MPTTKIKITFGDVACPPSANVWGKQKWTFSSIIDGTKVGSDTRKYDMQAGGYAMLGDEQRSREIDVSAKNAGDSVEAVFKVTNKAATGDVSQGEVRAKFNHPFDTEMDQVLDGSPVGAPAPASVFRVAVRMEITGDTPSPTPPSGAPVGKSGSGDTSNTVSKSVPPLRVEICPVVPVMQPDQLPPRPKLPVTVRHGRYTADSKAIALTGTPALNSLANPSVIPVLKPSDPEFVNRVARLAVTYLRPHDLDLSKLFWVVKSGPVKLFGVLSGSLSVLAYATAESPNPAEIELRYGGEKGEAIALFRAWAAPIKFIPIRATIVVGTNAGATPRATAADVKKHIDLANTLMLQAGLLFVPDPDTRTWDGAVADPTSPGMYVLKTTDDSMTVGVASNIPPHPMRLNFRPGAMHLCYVKSLSSPTAVGVGTDRPGLPGTDVSLDGTPSTSWLPPTGVKPDADAGSVTMKTMNASNDRNSQPDLDYITERKKVDPTFTDASIKQLYGCIMPDYADPSDPDWPQTLAHEVGHCMGLRHRGNPQTVPAEGKLGGNDGVNGAGGKGHPWRENVMSYGYTLSQDFDLIQTQLLRKHPCVVAVLPKPGPNPQPETESPLKELQALLGVPVTDVWDPATEEAASKNMVRYGSTGDIVAWVQRRLTALGTECGPVDGISGSKTVGGIKSWQGAHPPLESDGVAGPRTMQSLAEAT